MFYAGKVFTATQGGSRLVPVSCEKCRTGFHYELTRMGTGKASAPYYIGQDSAARRAERAAERDLQRRLTRDAELVPCPRCNWVNADTVDRYRWQKHHWAPWLFIPLMCAGVLVGLAVYSAQVNQRPHDDAPAASIGFIVLTGVLLVSPVWALSLQGMLRRRIDPNSTYPRPPVLPPGTPAALVQAGDANAASPQLAPVPAKRAQAASSGWCVFRPGQLHFPPQCCVCMAGAQRGYSPPFRVGKNSDLAIPICNACNARLRGNWWLTVLAITSAALLIGWIVPKFAPTMQEDGRNVMLGLAALIGPTIGVYVAASVCRPYRLGTLDGGRGLFKFAAKNPQYTALVDEWVHAQENAPIAGHVADPVPGRLDYQRR